MISAALSNKIIEEVISKPISYRPFCKILQNWYGIPAGDYYIKSGNGKLCRNNRIGRGQEGLQCHHICEDLVPGLSDPKIAAENDFAYQKAENLCYCNSYEHALLHILIAENRENVDTADDYITGVGGVRWMMLAINSIMCNQDTSWYSSQDAEGKGCNYNYNNIITGNKPLWKMLINKFCTSAFIRQRLSQTPKQLAESICWLCKKDGTITNSRLDIYDEILAEAGKSKLFDTNVNAFVDLEGFLEVSNSALVVICTGGGKTTTGLEYLRIHGAKALVVGPGDTIKDSWVSDGCATSESDWKDEHVTYMNYQSLMNSYEKLDWSQYSVLICDEAHHIKAERWGEGVRWVLKNHPSIKVIGLTATPTDDQKLGRDEEFQGRLCIGLDLAEGIRKGKIHPFSYIQSIYKIEEVKPEFDSYGTEGTLLWNRLNLSLNQNPIEKILRDNMPAGQRKGVIFCGRFSDIPEAIQILRKYDPEAIPLVLTSRSSKIDNEKIKKQFNGEKIKNVFLITVNMVNEGAHYEGINTLIMLRRTQSATLYLQQLGRIVVSTLKEDPHGIVFDFTNNAQNLIYNSGLVLRKPKDTDPTEGDATDINSTVRDIQEAIKGVAGTEVIYKDYTEDCASILSTLRIMQNTDGAARLIYTVFDSLVDQLDLSELEAFQSDLWGGLKDSSQNSNKSSKGKKPQHASNSDLKQKRKDSSTICNVIPASDLKKLATAYKLVIKRGYTFGFIDFTSDCQINCIVNNAEALKELAYQAGFVNFDLFMNLLRRTSKASYLMVATMD